MNKNNTLPLGMNDYRNRLPITPQMPAAYAIALLLWHEFKALTATEAVLHETQDDEALHDFRIAIRRTRALTSQGRSVLGRARTRHFLEEFKWVGSFTTPVRDLDVMALKLEDYGQAIPVEYSQNLDIIRDFLHQQRTVAYATLLMDIHSRRYQELIRDWRAYLESHLDAEHTADQVETILSVSNKKVWATYQKVMDQGRAITDQSPAESLHELRKTCKKLRYLIDFFSDLHGRKQVKRLIKILKKLQDYLGDFQDAEAHLHLLSRYRQHQRLDPRTRISFLLIVDLLANELHRRENALRKLFPDYFNQFDSDETHALMTTLYKD